MRKLYCSKCGCDRVLMLKSPTIRDQQHNIEYGLKTVCFVCLLDMAKVRFSPEARKCLKPLYAIPEMAEQEVKG